MDITNRDVRELTMSKYFTKKSIPYWIIAVLVILIAIILAVQFKANSSSQTTTSTVKTSSSSEKSSSSTKKYVEGKDYKITYSNTNSIDKSTITKALDANGLNDINDLMDTSEDGGDMAKVEVYYNKDKNLLVERLFKNGYKDNQPTQTVGYDLQKQAMNLDKTFGNDYLNQPLVYTWEKLTK
ncbi:alanyl-tRNA synthetase [Leuconostoc suionicum]|uniref:alanyl-tRNA synthetase n=1 Tax=Leuconostoc suionicum TaxID=1511761 RepID=UPI003C31D175